MDLWALDEVLFQQHGSRCRMWVPPEERDPIVRHAPTRTTVGMCGALRVATGQLVTRQVHPFNAATFGTFL